MTNAVYPKYKQSLLTEADTNKSLNLTGTNSGFVALVDLGTYTYSASHQYYSSLSGIVGTDQEITTPTVVNGLYDGDDATFSAVTGASVEALIFYRKNSGANSTWRLFLFEDTSVTGLPVTPNGGDIVITFNVSGIVQFSDRRLKENIREIGSLFGKLPIYEFNYKGGRVARTGLMAQDVERVVPNAVREFRGRKTVNYNRVIERLAA
jgi:hypothetical protein